MERIIKTWESNYYTEPLLIVMLLLTFWLSVKDRKKHSQLKLLPIYLGSFLLLICLIYYKQVYLFRDISDALSFKIDRVANYIVTLLEFFCFSFFLFRSSSSSKSKKIILLLTIISTAYSFIILFEILQNKNYRKHDPLHSLYTIELVSLLIGCVLHFVELLKTRQTNNFTFSINFWVFCGLAFYCISTIPITIIGGYIFKSDLNLYETLYSIIYFCYSIFFGMIIRGYMSKPSSVHSKKNYSRVKGVTANI